MQVDHVAQTIAIRGNATVYSEGTICFADCGIPFASCDLTPFAGIGDYVVTTGFDEWTYGDLPDCSDPLWWSTP